MQGHKANGCPVVHSRLGGAHIIILLCGKKCNREGTNIRRHLKLLQAPCSGHWVHELGLKLNDYIEKKKLPSTVLTIAFVTMFINGLEA